jgi:hypothetical protein
MHQLAINEFTSVIAQDAMRDILYMYWDLASSWGGFGHNVETGRFNQYLCIDATLEDSGWSSVADLAILHEGSAIKLLCFLSDLLDEQEESPSIASWLGQRLRNLLAQGRLDHLPEAKLAIELGLLGDGDEFRSQLALVYKLYVVDRLNKTFMTRLRIDTPS